MSALTNVRDTKQRTAELKDASLLTAIKVYKGAIVVLDTATGYSKPAVTGTGLVVQGIAAMSEAYIDTTGISSGVKKIPVKTGIFLLANSADADLITNAERGQPCYLVDDQTVAKTDGSSTRSVAGTVEEVVSAGVWVRLGSVDGTALAAEITARGLITTNLAKTTTPGGAALVGVFDTAGKYTATTVEAALAEDADARRIKVNTMNNTVGSVPVVHGITVPSGASGTVSVTLDATFGKVKIIDVHFIKAGSTGGSNDVVKLTDGTHDITDSLALNTKAAGAIVRGASISTTYQTLAAGSTLVADYTNATTSCEGQLYVTCLRVA